MNPLNNDIRYNSKIRYNVNLVCTKISGSCIFSLLFPCYSSGKHTFCVFVRIASLKKKKKKLFKSIRYSCFRQVHIKFLNNSKFDLTAKSLVTNSVVITRVLCTRTRAAVLQMGRVTGIIWRSLFLLLNKNVCCDASLEPSCRDSSNEGSQRRFSSRRV